VIQKLEQQIKQLQAAVNQIIRQGIVTSVYPDRGTVRVKLPDSGGIVSKELAVLFQKTQDNKDYDMPDIGEQVVCLFLPNGMEQGYVIGSPYSTVDKVPVTDADKKHYSFKDETWFEYDRKTHKFKVFIKGTIDIHADGKITIDSGEHIQLTAPRIDIN